MCARHCSRYHKGTQKWFVAATNLRSRGKINKWITLVQSRTQGGLQRQNALSAGWWSSPSCQWGWGNLENEPCPPWYCCAGQVPPSGLRARRPASSAHLTTMLLYTYASPTVGSSSKTRTKFLIYPVFLALSLGSST